MLVKLCLPPLKMYMGFADGMFHVILASSVIMNFMEYLYHTLLDHTLYIESPPRQVRVIHTCPITIDYIDCIDSCPTVLLKSQVIL